MPATEQNQDIGLVADGEGGLPAYRTPPHNPEAELALIGAILANNKQYDRVGDFLLPEHFADPANGRIYAACGKLIDRGQRADPVTLKNLFEQDGELEEIGGPQYLARLAGSVPMIGAAADYGREVFDCHLRRELIDLGELMVEGAFDHDLDRPAPVLIEQAEERLYGLAERGDVEGGFRDFKAALVSAIDMAESAYRRDGKLVGVPTGFADIDRMLGGLHPSDLIVVAGRPSMGKTAFATNLAYHAASSRRYDVDDEGKEVEHREVVGFFSLEMSAEQLATRILSEQTNVRSDAIRRGDIKGEEFERIFQASLKLQTLPLFIDDTPALTISALRTRARRLKRQHGLSLIVVDYLQLLQPSLGRRPENRVQEVSEVTRGLKALAKDLNVPVVALSQLSRAVEQREEKRPQLADLRESGSIEQDADVVMFLFRDEYYLDREPKEKKEHETDERYQKRMETLKDSRNKAEVNIAKQRHGPIGTVKLYFDGNFTRFSNLAEDNRLPEDVPF